MTEQPKKFGRQLADALMGSYKERMEEEKTIFLVFKPGERPSVNFTGFWSGKFIRAAMDSIAKAYRMAKSRPSRPLEKGEKNVPKSSN